MISGTCIRAVKPAVKSSLTDLEQLRRLFYQLCLKK